jgi:polyisoprenoid-binding protein YceI
MRLSALLTILFLMAGFSGTRAAEYDIDQNHSSVGFKVRHMMVSNVRGQFGEFAGAFAWDPADLGSSRVSATIQTGSVDTGSAKRDEHLRSADFFDATANPTITFVSTGIDPRGEGHYALRGDLTLHGVTRPVELDLVLVGEATEAKAGARMGWEATGVIKRSDFGVSWSKALDNGGVAVGDEVTVELAVEGVRKE